VGESERVAYLGPEATFTHLAARARFGSQATYLPVRSIGDVFYEVDRGKADYGVVPVENSTEGVVNYTLDQFTESDLKICAEELIPIRHVLMSGVSRLESVRTVFSHPQVFGQCRRWLDDRLPRARLSEVRSTAEAALRAKGVRGAAAIGTELAAGMYGLRILARDVEDLPGNYTRFFVLSRTWSRPTGNDKTSVMFAVKDRVGALYSMLQPFKRNRINLTSIESRPSRRRAWEYYFFVDFAGHVERRNVARALAELEKHCSVLKLLGSYPAAGPLDR
jgi:chorismate mutase/prephenate dehydratase